MSLATYVSEDGLFGHQWKESPLVVQTLYAPVQGNIRAKKWEWGRGVEGEWVECPWAHDFMQPSNGHAVSPDTI